VNRKRKAKPTHHGPNINEVRAAPYQIEINELKTEKSIEQTKSHRTIDSEDTNLTKGRVVVCVCSPTRVGVAFFFCNRFRVWLLNGIGPLCLACRLIVLLHLYFCLRIGICTRNDLETLNNCCATVHSDDLVTHLYCTNEKVNDENETRLANLSCEMREYTLEKRETFSDQQKMRDLPKQVLSIEGNYSEDKVNDARGGIFQSTLWLAVGCVVMVTVNVDVARGIVNGLRGTIIAMDDDNITITPIDGNGGQVTIERFFRYWGDVYVCQFPIRLAWAITVHKAQGLTLGKVVVDLSDAFAFGQVYTELSRFQCLGDVSLKTGLHPSRVWAHPKALYYYNMTVGQVTTDVTQLVIVAVADVIGEPCVLRGHLKPVDGMDGWRELTCSIVPNSAQNKNLVLGKFNRDNVEYVVQIKQFSRSKVDSGFPNPEWEKHKFVAIPASIRRARVGELVHRVDQNFVSDPNDTALNKVARVSLMGRTVKIESPGQVVLQAHGTDKNAPKLRLHFASNEASNSTSQPGQAYVFSNVRSCGPGHALIIDSLSRVVAGETQRSAQMSRLLSVPLAVFDLANIAGMFAEVLSCPNDVSGACFSPISLFSDENMLQERWKKTLERSFPAFAMLFLRKVVQCPVVANLWHQKFLISDLVLPVDWV
jgi:hypothetical protein